MQDEEPDEKGQEQKEKSEDESNEVEITEVEQNDILLDEEMESDWNVARIVCERIQDVVVDIQMTMQESGIEQQVISEYKNSIDQLINYVINQDKEKTMFQLIDLYNYSNIYNQKCFTNETLYLAKKLSYSITKSLIYLETNQEEQLKNSIAELASDVENVSNKVNIESIEYIKDRIRNISNNLKENIDNEEKENVRLKLVMLVELIPVIDNTIEY